MSETYGDYTYGKPIIKKYGKDANLTVGKFCSIADDVEIILGGEHEQNISTFPFFAYWYEAQGMGDYKNKGDVVIGNDVWIGTGVTILSGVTIGDGAIIGAKTIIAKNVEPYTIVIGNPAKVIDWRFRADQIEELLKIQWWNWQKKKIVEALPLICSHDIETFIQKYG